MLIALVTDAWHPQVNGVVRTWTTMLKILRGWGHEVIVISPEGSRTVPAPSEPDLRLCIQPRKQLKRLLGDVVPDALHIATEGPLGLAARRMALRRGWRFTTSFHTMFPDYLEARMGIPAWLPWRYMQWFHKPSQRVLVPTPTVRDTVARHGLRNLQVWSRGVDAERFRPLARRAESMAPVSATAQPAAAPPATGVHAAAVAEAATVAAQAGTGSDADDICAGLPRPIFLSVGRVAREKNLDAFLSLDLPGSKVVVGGGPDEERLHRKYPDVRFTGMQADDVLPKYYAAADVFVFPSLTDTFGLVMLEAMACGTPVAAFRTDAPLAVIEDGVTGCLRDDLRDACLRARELDRDVVRQHALTRTWDAIATDLLNALVPLTPATRYNIAHA